MGNENSKEEIIQSANDLFPFMVSFLIVKLWTQKGGNIKNSSSFGLFSRFQLGIYGKIFQKVLNLLQFC